MIDIDSLEHSSEASKLSSLTTFLLLDGASIPAGQRYFGNCGLKLLGVVSTGEEGYEAEDGMFEG